MLTRIGALLLALSMIAPALAQGPIGSDEIDRLLAQATLMNATRPASEVLAFIDSIEDQMASATPRQQAALELIRARGFVLQAQHDQAFEILDQLLGGRLDSDQRLRALKLAANLALALDEFAAGFEYLYEALVLQEEVDDPGLKSGVFGQAAYWHSQLGDQAKGLEYAGRTLQLARDSGDLREVCVAMEKLGQAEEMAGLTAAAIQTYQAGLQACENAGDPVFVGVMHALTGRLLMRSGGADEAETWMQQALDKLIEAGFEDGVTDTLTNYAELKFGQRRFDEAEVLLHQVLARTSNGERPKNRAEVYRMLAEIHRQRGDYRVAWENLDHHLRTRERVLDAERLRLIAFQEVQFDVRTREQELSLLREQARVAALQEQASTQRRMLRQLVYALGVSLLLLLLLIVLRGIRERRQLRHLSAHDGLTRLLNYTHFFAACVAPLQEAHLQRSPLTLVLADVDRFKRFNDRHGHQAGDGALREAARCFREALASHGPVGRIGGEEFAACLPGITSKQVVELIEPLRGALQACDFGEIEERISMSFGIAVALPGEDIDSLRARSDAALYEAKRKGRDCIVVAEAEPSPAAPA